MGSMNAPDGRSLSGPNRMVWAFFEHARRVTHGLLAGDLDMPMVREEACAAVFLSVTAVEVFLGAFFRLVVMESGDPAKVKLFEEHLKRRKQLTFKLEEWPRQFLGKALDKQSQGWRSFDALRDLRNSLVHFASGWETMHLGHPNILVEGLTDTTAYDSLDASSAEHALLAAESVVAEILRTGSEQGKVGRFQDSLHYWIAHPDSEWQ